jgi:hypothetical protein
MFIHALGYIFSMISASSGEDLNGDVPRSHRKKGSNRNIVSHDMYK